VVAILEPSLADILNVYAIQYTFRALIGRYSQCLRHSIIMIAQATATCVNRVRLSVVSSVPFTSNGLIAFPSGGDCSRTKHFVCKICYHLDTASIEMAKVS
jgi:hypothetical protein